MTLIAVSSVNAQWVQVAGSGGGKTRCITTVGSHLIAGTVGGVFRSTNRGAAWLPSNEGLTDTIIAFASNSSGLFAATNGTGVFRSTDDGAHWSPTNSTLTGLDISAIAAGDSVLVAGTNGNGLFRSTDAGTTWSAVVDGPTDVFIYSLATSDSFFFAGTFNRGMFRSAGNGEHWTAINTGFGSRFPDVNVRSLLAADTLLYAAASLGVYKSTNNGRNWSLTTALPASLGGVVTTLSLHDSTLLASNGVSIFCSTSQGAVWNTFSDGIPISSYNLPTVHSITPMDTSFFAGTDAGVFRLNNALHAWAITSNGLNASPVGPVVADGSSVFAVGRNGFGLFRSTDNGNTWTSFADTMHYHFNQLGIRKSCVIAQTDGPAQPVEPKDVLKSTDNGNTWMFMEKTLGNAIAINDTYIFNGSSYSSGGVLRCPLDSLAWTARREGLPDRFAILTLIADGANVFMGTIRSGIYRSSDNGDHWAKISTGLSDLDENAAVTALAGSGTTLFAGTTALPGWGIQYGYGIFRSTNNGTSWTMANNGLPGVNVSALAAHGSIVFASIDTSGVFLSANNGTTWVRFSTGLPNPYVSSLAANDSFVYAGMFGGLWRRRLSEALVSVPSPSQEVGNFRLEQNFPNPFNPKTVVRGQWPVTSKVKLVVYDMLGREVATLLDGEIEAGSHEVTFDGTGLSSGLYIYRLTVGGYVESRKMVLLR
jgi:photosystem II stability/assembly factor-like uncharacterized protein